MIFITIINHDISHAYAARVVRYLGKMFYRRVFAIFLSLSSEGRHYFLSQYFLNLRNKNIY